jgi:hypothetical protein
MRWYSLSEERLAVSSRLGRIGKGLGPVFQACLCLNLLLTGSLLKSRRNRTIEEF